MKIYIKEFNELSNKTIICVDIQPEYMSGITFLEDWIEFLNTNYEDNKIVLLYNGYDTLGMISEHDYQMWLIENGLEEEAVDYIEFYDKGYAFFRNCMDYGIEHDQIVELVRYMKSEDINDSREIESHNWDAFIKQSGISVDEIREYLEDNEDMINIPDLMDYLKRFKNIVLMGGGVDECLAEVEIALSALGKSYHNYDEFIY